MLRLNKLQGLICVAAAFLLPVIVGSFVVPGGFLGTAAWLFAFFSCVIISTFAILCSFAIDENPVPIFGAVIGGVMGFCCFGMMAFLAIIPPVVDGFAQGGGNQDVAIALGYALCGVFALGAVSIGASIGFGTDFFRVMMSEMTKPTLMTRLQRAAEQNDVFTPDLRGFPDE